MRAYIDGILSVSQGTFIPEDLWFATEGCGDNTFVSKECLCLSGLTCESKVEDKEFSCRWKGILLTYINDNGEEVETEDFTVKEFIRMIKDKDMKLINASAYFDTNVNLKITEFSLVDIDGEVIFDQELIDDDIELIA